MVTICIGQEGGKQQFCLSRVLGEYESYLQKLTALTLVIAIACDANHIQNLYFPVHLWASYRIVGSVYSRGIRVWHSC